MRLAMLGGAVAIAALATSFLVEESHADLESQVFTSRADKLRLVVPRGWVATEQPSYPGLLLSMMRDQPEGRMMLTAEAFTRQLYCGWPALCRNNKDPLATKYACALRLALGKDRKLKVGPVQAGPKATGDEATAMSSMWFEYDDGKHFVRQAVALSTERAVSLVLVASTSEARSSHARAFEQALRTMATTVEEAAAIVVADASVAADDGPVPVADAAMLDAGAMFESAPAPRIEPVGSCPEVQQSR